MFKISKALLKKLESKIRQLENSKMIMRPAFIYSFDGCNDCEHACEGGCKGDGCTSAYGG